MNKLKHLPKSVPRKSHEFDVQVKGNTTGHFYEGSFKCKITTHREQAQIAKNKAFLNAGFDAVLDANTKNFHHMVSYLKYSITDGPDWFQETDCMYDLIGDENVLETVYYEVLNYEEKWLKSIWGDDEETEDEQEEEEGSSQES